MLPPRVRSAELWTRTVLQRDCSAKKALAQPTQDTAQECLFNRAADLVVEQLAGTATDTAENDGECGKTPACIIPWDNGCTCLSAITGKKKKRSFTSTNSTHHIHAAGHWTITRLTTGKNPYSPSFTFLRGRDEGGTCLCASCRNPWHTLAKPARLHFWHENFKTNFYCFQWKFHGAKNPRSSFQSLCCLVATQILKQFSKRERFSSCFSCSCPNWFFQPFVFLAFLKHICIWGLGYHCYVMTWDHLALHKTGINPTYMWCLRNTIGSCS